MECMISGTRNLPPFNDWLALKMNRYLQGAHMSECMTKGKTTLIPENPSKGTTPNNYIPITYLQMMRKILTAQIREDIYNWLTSREFFPEEQKKWCKGSKGTADLLTIRQHIFNESKTEIFSFGLDWLQKGIWYDSAKLDNNLPRNGQNIRRTHKLYRETHENLQSEIDSSLAEENVQRGIFHGYAISPLLFIIAIIPLNHILRKCTAR